MADDDDDGDDATPAMVRHVHAARKLPLVNNAIVILKCQPKIVFAQ